MGLLLGFTVVAIICTGLLAKMILWLTDKTGHAAITSYFQAAEYILNHHHAPPHWTKRQFNVLQQPLATLRSRKNDSDTQMDTRQMILQRLDDLIVYFEHCTFFEDERARDELLKQLTAERENWQQLGLSQILGQSD